MINLGIAELVIIAVFLAVAALVIGAALLLIVLSVQQKGNRR